MKAVFSVINTIVCTALIFLVRAYKVVLSPMLGNCCRFEPSCSAYCVEALRTHGAIRGVWLTARRLLRCRPFGPSGYDPVPPARPAQGGTSNIQQGMSNDQVECASGFSLAEAQRRGDRKVCATLTFQEVRMSYE